MRPRPEVLIGGTPARLVRLTTAGARLVDGWIGAGTAVGAAPASRALAGRLVDAGLLHPVPPAPRRVALTAVIPVKDDPHGLIATLLALRRTAPAVPVVVVDDGSAVPVRPTGVEVCRRAEAGGPAPARNAGAARTGPEVEVIAFVDAGCQPGAGWMAPLLAHFADPAVAAVAPRIANRAGSATPWGRYDDRHSPLDLGPDPSPVRPYGRVPYVPATMLLVRRRALVECGGFDETLRFGEDVDLVWRLLGAGWRVRYEPAAVATHPSRPHLRQWLRQRYDYGSSAAPLAARHGPAVAPLVISPGSLTAWTALAAGRPLPAAAVATAGTTRLAHRQGRTAGGRFDPATAAALGRLSVSGHLAAGRQLASALRRAYLPLAAAGLVATRLHSRAAPRTRTGAVRVAAVLTGVVVARPDPRRAAWGLADDLAYQAGLWAGAVRLRSAAALRPRFRSNR